MAARLTSYHLSDEKEIVAGEAPHAVILYRTGSRPSVGDGQPSERREGKGREGKEDGLGFEIEEPLQQIVCCSDDLVKRFFGTF